MKIFISHQKDDSSAARAVAGRLNRLHGIASYLDVVDLHLAKVGENVGEYLRTRLGECSHLLVVVSTSTKGSWWVPWEIGIATEKDYPLATYASASCSLPGFLKKWPYLQSDYALDKYARAVKLSSQRLTETRRFKALSAARADSTALFYRSLRTSLGQ